MIFGPVFRQLDNVNCFFFLLDTFDISVSVLFPLLVLLVKEIFLSLLTLNGGVWEEVAR